MMFTHDGTRRVRVGNVPIGGGAPVSVQTMTDTYTHEIDKTVAQIRRMAAGGADLVRVAVPHKADTDALREIVGQSPVPIVADVHFHFDRALEAVAAGVHKIRLNPGNIKDRAAVLRVIDACRDAGVPIRVGVNEGGVVERSDAEQRRRDKAMTLVDLMVARLADYIRIFEQAKFEDVVLSAKSINARTVIDVYTEIAKRWDYPLHLGVTHAGPPETGTIRSSVALGTLLAQGIGDTIRVSFAADPITEVEAGKEILYVLGLRKRTEPELIACPTCGRIEVDLIKLVQQVKARLADLHSDVKVAIMGCVVNGPGEAEGADVAVFAGKGRGVIYRDSIQTRTVPEADMLDALLAECRTWEANKHKPLAQRRAEAIAAGGRAVDDEPLADGTPTGGLVQIDTQT
ncbi:MAG: 4-hydroxy-3-methylbut-2-en-1-yl diphosphate synthase (flavodoxin) [Phycisphaerae bacterium]|nr:4-hydroxy-3-methylbut-2-en-1-yl diphosphate synthase (flavodoxin) [Phycisphaerae bacterium]